MNGALRDRASRLSPSERWAPGSGWLTASDACPVQVSLRPLVASGCHPAQGSYSLHSGDGRRSIAPVEEEAKKSMVNTTFRKVFFTFRLAALALAPASHLSAQPTVTVLDSIVLEESGDNYLVLPAPVTPDGTGGYLIADYDQPRVLHYGGEGRFIQRYGREGEGPGEWKEARVALPWGDDQVMVFSWDPPAAHAFRRNDGQFVARHSLRTVFESVVVDAGEVWLSGAVYTDRSAVGRTKLGDDEVEPVVGLPEEFEAGGPLGGIFPEMPFVKWADTLLVGFMPLPYLTVTDTQGEELDRFEVPVVRRRGHPGDPGAAIRETLGGGRYPDVFGLFSLTRGIHRRPDGSFLVVHFDLGTDGPPVSTEAMWVSVIDPSRSRACPDGRIPLEEGSHPAIGFEGDLLLVLDQVVRGGDAETVVRRIQVETDDCDWVPLTR